MSEDLTKEGNRRKKKGEDVTLFLPVMRDVERPQKKKQRERRKEGKLIFEILFSSSKVLRS